jgi:16S rRNA (cytidine1402-2'-O)-methyltransferase
MQTQSPNTPAAALAAAAQLWAGHQSFPAGCLYLVATPIGNLADISLRAFHVLGLVDAVACEDTRHTAALLTAYGLHKPLLAAHEHNEREAADAIVQRLQAGQRVAYVSDAGTPAVSDPGCWLAQAALQAGCQVMPLPGASSAVVALSASGADSRDGFAFFGFLPQQAQAQQACLDVLRQAQRPQVLFEAPHRIQASAKLLAALGEQTITVCRELTKQFETVALMAAQDLPAWLAADPKRSKGEFVIVVHPAAQQANSEANTDAQLDRVLKLLLPQLSLKSAVALAVDITSQPKNQVYARAVALKGSDTA